MKRLWIAFMICLGFAVCCVGCTQPTTHSPSSVSQSSSAEKPTESTAALEPPAPQPTIPQDYAPEDFLDYWSDEVLFAPQSEDYILTERYWQGEKSYFATELINGKPTPVEKQIIYHITRIHEFDPEGKLIDQRERYIFQTDWQVPRDVYLQDMAERADYMNVKLVEQAIYAEVSPDHLDSRTKQQMVDDLAAKEEK